MSAVQVMTQSGTGVAADRTPFFGAKIPPELKKLVQASKTLELSIFKNVVKCVTEYLETGGGSEEAIASLVTEKCGEEIIRIVFAGVHSVLSLALRLPRLKAEVFKEDLKLIRLPSEMITTLSGVIFGSKRSRLEQSQLQNRVRLPKLSNLKWRVDVEISNSSVHRVLERTILMEMTLSNGTIKTFEVPISQFHELRYSVAYVLKEMEDLEKRNILKLQD